VKAAILVKQNAPLTVAEVDLPKLDIGQVLVKIDASGICGKQMEEISGKRGADPYIPHLLGHEGAGTVVEIGPGVRKVNPGDHVVLHWVKGSGMDSLPPRYNWDDTEISAGWVTTLSEYTVASENRLTVIPQDIPSDVASLLGCAVTTGLGIVFNNAALMPGQSIAIFGVGGIGLNVIQGAALVNAYPIVAIDLFDDKLEQAESFGATHKIRADQDDLLGALTELTGGQGFDAAVDTTGNAKVRQTTYQATGNKGRAIFAGVPHIDEQITIDSFPIHFGRKVIGSHGGETDPDIDIPRYVQLYQLGKLKLDELISHRYRLDGINQAVETVSSGKARRCVVEMGSL